MGTWRDKIRVDQAAVQAYVGGEIAPAAGGFGKRAKFDIQKDVIELCPTRCMEWNGKKLTIYNDDCTRCMHCINVMPEALRPGKDTGVTILVGGKAPILEGALMSWVLIPFMKFESPYQEFKDLAEKIWEWWDENGKMRERLGEVIERMSMRKFLEAMGLPAVPQMVKTPRYNPYIFF